MRTPYERDFQKADRSMDFVRSFLLFYRHRCVIAPFLVLQHDDEE